MNSKLQAISALSVSFLTLHAENTQAQFSHDYYPDLMICPDTSYVSGIYEVDFGDFALDLNSDGVDDFSFQVRKAFNSYGGGGSYAKMVPLGGNGFVGESTVLWGGATAATAEPLEVCMTVGPSADFAYASNVLFRAICTSLSAASCFEYSNSWNIPLREFIGIKVFDGSDVYYGWIRIQFEWSTCCDKLRIDAYHLNDVPGLPVTIAYLGPAAFSTLDDSGPGMLEESIRLQFDKPTCIPESLVGEYRIYVVKGSPLEEAVYFEPFYHTVLPTGGPYDITLPAGMRTSTGDTIKQFEPYWVHLLTVPADGSTPTNGMVGRRLITLTDGGLPVANNLTLEDLGNNLNTSDFRLRFNVPASELGIGQYEVFLVPDAFLPIFDLTFADSCSFKMEITPTGSDFEFVLDAGLRDINGYFPFEGLTYHAVILSRNNPSTSYPITLSPPSNPATYANVPYPGLPPDDGDDDDTW